jgi:hypothetical protein
MIIKEIIKQAEEIQKKTKRGKPNFVMVSEEVYLKDKELFDSWTKEGIRVEISRRNQV